MACRGLPQQAIAWLMFLGGVSHNRAAVGLGAGGIGAHTSHILEGGVDDMPLIGVHGLQGDVAAVLDHLGSGLVGQPLEGLLPAGTIPFRIHMDAHPVAAARLTT